MLTIPWKKKLKADISKIESSADIFIFADKTSTIYGKKLQEHEKLVMENITKTYQRVPGTLENAINIEDKNIAESYEFAERIYQEQRLLWF